MESALLVAGLQGASADAGATRLAAQGTRFESLMQQPAAGAPGASYAGAPGVPSPVIGGDRYTDEVAPPAKSSERGVALPDEIAKLGQDLSDEMRTFKSRFDSGSKKVTDPYLLEVLDQIKAAVDYQHSITKLTVTMKSVELSVQSCSQLFKMQG
jgi:hypothetical protein